MTEDKIHDRRVLLSEGRALTMCGIVVREHLATEGLVHVTCENCRRLAERRGQQEGYR